MQIQWYPGHMAKAKRLLQDQLRRVDAVLELCDARLPLSSRNPELIRLAAGKPRLVVLNKADLADEAATKRWVQYLKTQGDTAFQFNAARGNAKLALAKMEALTRPMVERMAARGARKTVRLMVVGVPNVGKSTFVNRLSGGATAKTGDKPGVTRSNQWIRVTPYLELLDTPGLLWPKLSDETAARRLAYLGTIRDDILDTEHLAAQLLTELDLIRPKEVRARFKLPEGPLPGEPIALLNAVCQGRGFLLAGGRFDTARAAAIALDEYRAGLLGRITLEDAPCQS